MYSACIRHKEQNRTKAGPYKYAFQVNVLAVPPDCGMLCLAMRAGAERRDVGRQIANWDPWRTGRQVAVQLRSFLEVHAPCHECCVKLYVPSSPRMHTHASLPHQSTRTLRSSLQICPPFCSAMAVSSRFYWISQSAFS